MVKVCTLTIEQSLVNNFINNVNKRDSYYITIPTDSLQSDPPQNTEVNKLFYNH